MIHIAISGSNKPSGQKHPRSLSSTDVILLFLVWNTKSEIFFCSRYTQGGSCLTWRHKDSGEKWKSNKFWKKKHGRDWAACGSLTGWESQFSFCIAKATFLFIGGNKALRLIVVMPNRGTKFGEHYPPVENEEHGHAHTLFGTMEHTYTGLPAMSNH